MNRILPYCLLFLIGRIPARAAVHDSLLSDKRSVEFRYENDFFTATDRYYTQGIKLGFTHKILRKSPFSWLLIRSKYQGIHEYSISAEQNCFTPRSIRVDTIQLNERPFAAVFMVSHKLLIYFTSEKQRFESRLDLGVMGPCAMCEEEQKGIHHALNNIQPLGWEYQLPLDYIINYTLTYEKGYLNSPYIDAIWLSQLRLGSLYTDATLAATMRIGKLNNYFSPATPAKKLSAYFFITSALRGVIYNATLQGGVFNSQEIHKLAASEISRLVPLSKTGFTIHYNRFSIDYSYTFMLEEYKTGLTHAWGGVHLQLQF